MAKDEPHAYSCVGETQMKRWKFFYPLVRCPWCRKWVAVDHRGNVTLRRPRKTELAEVKRDE